MTPTRLVFATRNAHKLKEVRAMLSDLPGLELVDLDSVGVQGDPPETGDTFEANALQKARWVHALTGLPCVADDSGLEVDALGGAPGVYSKRFSPEQTHEANNALLLSRLEGVTDRRARFRCVLAVVDGEREWTVDGRCEGAIGHGLRGEHGFGYDPLFLPDEAPGRSLAELSMEDKNRISHRGRAFVALATCLG
ncbi:MAG: RdgB/HAM1 family non-canonical purine NTP pyrophosphatase [Alphaproteobacteria bacterium]|nr:RdgB/HAM1 family non-canonical purine NTP pyrophosphatase [Alphaproteobacteria bacterium]MCB9699645.1 RdgB/HAM1 family non-canonical purine NTP pyrophosphatase [Alphaproteobacteria bacterium]